MSDSPTNETDMAIRRLVKAIRNEKVPERILALARDLQTALDRQDRTPDGRRDS